MELKKKGEKKQQYCSGGPELNGTGVGNRIAMIIKTKFKFKYKNPLSKLN